MNKRVVLTDLTHLESRESFDSLKRVMFICGKELRTKISAQSVQYRSRARDNLLKKKKENA